MQAHQRVLEDQQTSRLAVMAILSEAKAVRVEEDAIVGTQNVAQVGDDLQWTVTSACCVVDFQNKINRVEGRRGQETTNPLNSIYEQ